MRYMSNRPQLKRTWLRMPARETLSGRAVNLAMWEVGAGNSDLLRVNDLSAGLGSRPAKGSLNWPQQV